MHKTNGRLTPANKAEKASFRDRYFKCEKCRRIVVATNVEFSEQKICDECGGNMYETNPYKGPEHY